MHVISQIPTTATLKTLAEHESLVVLAVRELLFQTLSLEDMSAMAPALAVEETSLYMATFLIRSILYVFENAPTPCFILKPKTHTKY